MKIVLVCIALIISGCVRVDPDSGRTLPRGNQKYLFEKVESNAENLQPGMSKLDVLILLGSPAEMSSNGNVWDYLPERPAVLIPSRGLRVEFKNDVLESHGYRPIIAGQSL